MMIEVVSESSRSLLHYFHVYLTEPGGRRKKLTSNIVSEVTDIREQYWTSQPVPLRQCIKTGIMKVKNKCCDISLACECIKIDLNEDNTKAQDGETVSLDVNIDKNELPLKCKIWIFCSKFRREICCCAVIIIGATITIVSVGVL